MERCDILSVGAGAAGIAAAKAAWGAGCRQVLLVDRRQEPGGVLGQCAHHGFGPNLTGPEYSRSLLGDFPEGIRWYPNTTVLSLTREKTAWLSGPDVGRKEIGFQQVILATGCLEIPMGALPIAGTRPREIYTAGQMQERMNRSGYVPAGPVVILGGGDLGLIMAGHLGEKGIPVTVVEQRDTCGALARNQRCLGAYPIELLLGCTISQVLGYPHLEGVITSKGQLLPCKSLLIAAGLRPDQELAEGLGNPPWLHLCGNCSRVHPMVEAVVREGTQAGIAAWKQIRGTL